MEKVPLSLDEKPGESHTMETGIGVGDTVIKNIEADEEKKGTPTFPSATNPFKIELEIGSEEKVDDSTTKL